MLSLGFAVLVIIILGQFTLMLLNLRLSTSTVIVVCYNVYM